MSTQTEAWQIVAKSNDCRCILYYHPNETGYRIGIQAAGKDIWQTVTLKAGLAQIEKWNKSN